MDRITIWAAIRWLHLLAAITFAVNLLVNLAIVLLATSLVA